MLGCEDEGSSFIVAAVVKYRQKAAQKKDREFIWLTIQV